MMMTLFQQKLRFMTIAVLVIMIIGFVTTTAASTTTTTTIGNKIISHHPSSISNVLKGLQKYYIEQDIPSDTSNVYNCCFITSKSVSKKQQTIMIQEILSLQGGEENDATMNIDGKIIASSNGIVLSQPSTIHDVIQTIQQLGNTNCCQNIIYYPDPIDIQRNGEGLLHTLGPLIEQYVSSSSSSSSSGTKSSSPIVLYVIVTADIDPTIVQKQLEQSINEMIPYLIVPNEKNKKQITTIHDIIPTIVYVSPQSVVSTVIEQQKSTTTVDNDENRNNLNSILNRIGSSTTTTTTSSSLLPTVSKIEALSSQNIAAYSVLHPIAQQQYDNVVESIQRTCSSSSEIDDNNDSKKNNIKLVPDFGKLCDSIISEEVDKYWYGDASSSTVLLRKSNMGQQIYNKLKEDLFMYIAINTYTDQMNVLQKTYYDLFKKELSKLVISPNLQHDMNKIGQQSISSFITSAVKMVPNTSFATNKSHTSYFTSYLTSAQRMYVRKVMDYISNRILLARSTNKFRPIPRKGVTIGLHYLLPKPFGNDYRQEPSMIHATDNMVYVPNESKLSDVNPNQIVSGNNEWMNSLVPHPPGNDLIYMQ